MNTTQNLKASTGKVIHIATAPNSLQSKCAPFGRMGARPMVLRPTAQPATCKTCLKATQS